MIRSTLVGVDRSLVILCVSLPVQTEYHNLTYPANERYFWRLASVLPEDILFSSRLKSSDAWGNFVMSFDRIVQGVWPFFFLLFYKLFFFFCFVMPATIFIYFRQTCFLLFCAVRCAKIAECSPAIIYTRTNSNTSTCYTARKKDRNLQNQGIKMPHTLQKCRAITRS